MIASPEIRLRAIEREDLPLFVAWLNDHDVRAHLSRQLPISRAAEERWFESVLAEPPEGQPLAMEIPHATGWNVIGTCGLHRIDWRSRSAGLGILIGDKDCWNQGHGTRAVGLLLRYAFAVLNLHRVWLEVFESNHRAVRCYEKAGFVREGCQRDGVFREGRYETVWTFGILEHEWRAGCASAPGG